MEPMTSIAESRCLGVAQDLRDRATIYDVTDPDLARFLRSAAAKLVRATKREDGK